MPLTTVQECGDVEGNAEKRGIGSWDYAWSWEHFERNWNGNGLEVGVNLDAGVDVASELAKKIY